MTERFHSPRSELRHRTLRGVVVTGVFLVAIDALVLVQGLLVMRLLGPTKIGLYGLVSTAVIALIALKRIGIDEAFVAQNEPDQEAEFKYAFTLELILAGAMTVLICALAPLVALLNSDSHATALMISLAYLPLAFALQAPLWIFFRRMDYRRQRSLQAIQPLVGLLVTVPLAYATRSVWSLVIGQVAGYFVAVAVTLAVSPYRIGLRFDRAVARRYMRFAVPVFVTVVAAMVVIWGQVAALDLYGGYKAAGYIFVAVSLTRYVDRADQIITSTIYPVICAIQDSPAALRELYVKSNRATLMWVLPYAAAIVLFAPDLVQFVIGREYHGAIVLLQGLAVVGAVTQLGFNWFSFFRARNQTRPPAIEAVVGGVAFLVLCVAGLAAYGFEGFVVGRIAAALIALAVRRYFTRTLLPGIGYASLLAPAIVPLGIAVTASLALRAATWGGARTLLEAIAELVIFAGVYVALVLRREEELVAELVTSVRSSRGVGAVAGGCAPASAPERS